MLLRSSGVMLYECITGPSGNPSTCVPSHSVVQKRSLRPSTGRHLPICVNWMNSCKIQTISNGDRAMLPAPKLTYASIICAFPCLFQARILRRYIVDIFGSESDGDVAAVLTLENEGEMIQCLLCTEQAKAWHVGRAMRRLKCLLQQTWGKCWNMNLVHLKIWERLWLGLILRFSLFYAFMCWVLHTFSAINWSLRISSFSCFFLEGIHNRWIVCELNDSTSVCDFMNRAILWWPKISGWWSTKKSNEMHTKS